MLMIIVAAPYSSVAYVGYVCMYVSKQTLSAASSEMPGTLGRDVDVDS